MTQTPRYIVNFIADNGEEWQDEEAQYIPRVGDVQYPYEHAKGVYVVEEVWQVGESNGPVTQGTNVFLREIPWEGSRLQKLHPDYYTS